VLIALYLSPNSRDYWHHSFPSCCWSIYIVTLWKHDYVTLEENKYQLMNNVDMVIKYNNKKGNKEVY
jgi:hypothetical protein